MVRQLSILHVISNLNAGGAEKMVVTAANLFVTKGHKVGVALLTEKGPLVEQLDLRVQLHHINRKNRFDWSALTMLSKLANSYNLIHVHLKHNLKFVFVANLVHRIKVPIILHDHSAEVLTLGVSKTNLPFFILYWLRNLTYIGVSESLVIWAIKNFRLNPTHCYTLPNAVECSLITEGVQNYSKEVGVMRLVLVSNFRRIKNIEFAVILVNKLSEQGVDVRLDVFGQSLDKAYYKEITDLIIEFNLQKQIVIHTNVSDIGGYLYKYDLAIHCSRAETGPLVLLEYLCAGLPFVSIDRGEVTKVIVKQFPDLVIQDYRVDEWCVRVTQLERSMYKDSLRSFFKTEFSTEVYFNKLSEIYSYISRK